MLTRSIRPYAAALALAAPLFCLAPAARADDSTPKPGEIAVSGTVSKLLPNQTGFVLLVSTITRPDGTTTTLSPPRPKAILTTIGLDAGDTVSAVGKDMGVGKPLSPRLLFGHRSTTLPTAGPTQPALPAPWTTADVGKVGLPGSASYHAGTFTVTGSGDDMFGSADAFRFVSQPLHGDGQIVARIVTYQRRDQWTKLGLMVRETLDAGSKCADVLVTPDADKGAEFQWRTNTGGDTQTTDQIPSPTPFWVKLTRVGDVLTGSVSKDGKSWQRRGQATVPMNADALIGLCVCSHNNAATTEAKIDSVAVAPASRRGGARPRSVGGGVPPPPILGESEKTWSGGAREAFPPALSYSGPILLRLPQDWGRGDSSLSVLYSPQETLCYGKPHVPPRPQCLPELHQLARQMRENPTPGSRGTPCAGDTPAASTSASSTPSARSSWTSTAPPASSWWRWMAASMKRRRRKTPPAPSIWRLTATA